MKNLYNYSGVPKESVDIAVIYLIFDNIVYGGIRREDTEGGSATRITDGYIGGSRGVGDGDTGGCTIRIKSGLCICVTRLSSGAVSSTSIIRRILLMHMPRVSQRIRVSMPTISSSMVMCG
jgi:hypothetical protein